MEIVYCSKCGKMIPPGGPDEGKRYLVGDEPVCPRCYKQIPEEEHTGGTMMVSDAVGPQPAAKKPETSFMPRPRTTKLNLPAARPPSSAQLKAVPSPRAERRSPSPLLWAGGAVLVLGTIAAWLLLRSPGRESAGASGQTVQAPATSPVKQPAPVAPERPQPAQPPPGLPAGPAPGTPPLATSGTVFQESGGLVVMEAENFSAQQPDAGTGEVTSWARITDLAGFSGAGALRAMPQDRRAYRPNDQTGARLDYRIAFAKPGTYQLWVRMAKGPDECDTVHVGLDGRRTAGVRCSQTTWQWSASDGGPAKVQVAEPGVHVLNIWIRESRTCIDRIILTTDEAFKPEGPGPAESPRSDAERK